MAQHYNWQIGIINKNTSCLLLSGEISSQREGRNTTHSRDGDPFFLPRLGTTLTSVTHPKADFEGFKSKRQFSLQSFLAKFCRLWAGDITVYYDCGGRGGAGVSTTSQRNLTRPLLTPRIHAFLLLFPNSKTEGHVVIPATWKIIIAGDDENCHGRIIRKHSWL